MRTYGTLALRGDWWVMDGIAPHVAIRLKHMFPRVPKHATAPFRFPVDQMHCADIAWFITRYPLSISAFDHAALMEGKGLFEAEQAERERILLPDYEPSELAGLRPDQVIRPYQGQAIDLTKIVRGLLLGDDLGLGKTYTAAGLMLMSAARPAAVVVQAHLQRQWARKIGEFTNLTTHLIKKTKPYDLPPADVYIFRYSQILGWVDFFAQGFFKSATFDEIQELRTGEASSKGVSAKKLAEMADYRLGLSATPIYNYGSEIWNIMQYINPDILGNFQDFDREWCVPSNNSRIKDPAALGTFLREQHVFLRRTKRDVGQQVPPINRIIETVPSDGKAIENIESLAYQLAVRTTSGSFTERGQAGRELDLLVRHATGVGKAHHVANYVRILLEADVPVLLMGWHRDVYEIWLKELERFRPVMYTGSESPVQKEESRRKFIAGETNLFIMSLRSGAGLDGLQARCSTVVFGELDWSPKVHEQVIGRLDREGQTEQVTAIYLNSEDGSDPPMVDILGVKASQSTGIVDPMLPFQAVHTDENRVKVLAKQFLEKRRAASPQMELTEAA